MNKVTALILFFIVLISLFLNVYQRKPVPPCFNADEAAFGYNAYSILKTGKDEYDTTLPLRLKSFGDYKLPLYSYLSIPFIGLLGLNEISSRMLNTITSVFFPIVIFFLTLKLFKNQKIALTSSFLIAISTGLHIVSRHTHEAYITAFLTALSTLFFINLINKRSNLNLILFLSFFLLALFGYHPTRIFAIYFLAISVLYFLLGKRRNLKLILGLIVILGIFGITDLIYAPKRATNLLYFNNAGFHLKVDELKIEGGIKYFNNEIVNGGRDLVFNYFRYLSPQFFLLEGDANPRFGYKGLSIMGPLEYIGIFFGFYFLFKNREKWRYFVSGLFFISPLSASILWTDLSLTRTLFFLIIALVISAYGLINFIHSLKNNRYFLPIAIGFILLFFGFTAYNWSFYLFHYSKREIVVRAWQCGYKDITDYIKENYNKYNKFYITKMHGEPYIFLLFYLKYPPEKYQKQASLSAPDRYGFGQVGHFDKFIFDFKTPKKESKYVTIGYPEGDFSNILKEDKPDLSKIKRVIYAGHDIFWIYEKP